MRETDFIPTDALSLRVAVVHGDAAAAARLCASLNVHRHRVEVYSGAAGLVEALEGHAPLNVAFLGATDLVLAHAHLGDCATLLVQVGGAPVPAADACMPARYTAAELRTCLRLIEKLHRLRVTQDRLRLQNTALRAALGQDLELPLLTASQVARRLLRLESTPHSVRAELETIAHAATAASERLDQLRVADGDAPLAVLEPEPRVVSIRQTVAEVLELAGIHPTAVLWEPEGADPIVNLDPVHFRMALEGLLADARRRLEGTGRLSIHATDGSHLVVCLNGIQTPTEPAFEASRAVVEKSGGRLEVRHRPGQPPLVWMEWPGLVELRDAEVNLTPTPTSEERLSVWMVDDETMVRRATERLLIHLRHEIRLFERGSDLVEALPEAARQPDLILADCDLPGMSGLEVLKRVRSLSPGAARVLYTGLAPGPAVLDAVAAGTVQRYVQKTDGVPALESILRTIVDARKGPSQTPVMTEEGRMRIELDDLLESRKLTMFVQPIYDANTGAWVACEALLRSLHPAFKGPLDILDAARISDRTMELQKVLAEMSREIRDELPEEVILFVNVDPAILRSVKRLDETLCSLYPVSKNVVLELTERARVCHEAGWEDVVQHMRLQGFKVALDDVGAGYNSLGAVAAVQPEVIKLDISLISHIDRDNRKAELVRILCDYARRYDLATVAEGIERAEEAERCRELGVRWLQGYHLGRPMPLDKLLSLQAQ